MKFENFIFFIFYLLFNKKKEREKFFNFSLVIRFELNKYYF